MIFQLFSICLWEPATSGLPSCCFSTYHRQTSQIYTEVCIHHVHNAQSSGKHQEWEKAFILLCPQVSMISLQLCSNNCKQTQHKGKSVAANSEQAWNQVKICSILGFFSDLSWHVYTWILKDTEIRPSALQIRVLTSVMEIKDRNFLKISGRDWRQLFAC